MAMGKKTDNYDNTEGMRVGEGVVGGGRGRDGYSDFFSLLHFVRIQILFYNCFWWRGGCGGVKKVPVI